MGITNVFSRTIVHVFLLISCNFETNLSHRVFEVFYPEVKTQTSIELPNFGSCPDGWIEDELDAGEGYRIPYCKPPNLSELNPDSPLSPSPPNFLPCAGGWTEGEDVTTGLVTCHPYGPDGPEDCDGDDEGGNIDKIHFPGELGCVRIGRSCSEESLWATDLPDDRTIVYVQAGADFGEEANGSQAAPFGSIGAAIEHAQSDAIIALSKGIYDEPVVLPRGILLWGACVAETEVTSSIVSETEAVIFTDSADTEVRNLRITGQRWGVFVLGSSARIHIEDVVVKSAHVIGIFVASGSATVKNVVVRDTQSSLSDGFYGRGLHIEEGASVEVSRSVFTNNREIGIFAEGPNTELKLHDVRVSNTQSEQSNGLFGRGLQIQEEASAEVARSVFTNNKDYGISAYGANTKLKLHEVLVSDTQSKLSDGTCGRGLHIEDGASVEVARSAFTNNRDIGVLAYGTNTELYLHDVLVRDTQSSQNDGKLGRGLHIDAGASVEVDRSVFTNNREVGISARGTNTELSLRDVLVNHTQGRQRDENFGRGFQIEEGASVEVTRSVFTNNRDIGISARGTNTELYLRDVQVSHTQSQQSYEKLGSGLEMHEGASVEVSRSVFTNNREFGIFASGSDTELNLHDVLVSDTQSSQSDGRFGRGLIVQDGAFVGVSRSVFKDNKEVGIYASGTDAKVTLNDVIIEHTTPSGWYDSSGTGIGSYGGAYIEMNRFVVTRNALCGMQTAFGSDGWGNSYEHCGELTISNGIISHNKICGINVQTDSVNFNELSQNVLYFDNNYNSLDSVSMPIPGKSKESSPLD